MPHPFRFGAINEQMLPAPRWAEHARRVEALGYATFLIRDHLVGDFFGDQYGPIAAMATAAAVTRTLRVGSMVICNDFRHPAVLAKEAATIDALSGGRFELGIGAGWLTREYDLAGLPFDPPGRRIERLGEAIEVIRGLWSEVPLHYAGEHYRIDGLDGMPKPAQRLPRILVGGGHRRMLTLAGRVADSVGLLTTSVASGSVDDSARERLAPAVRQKLGWVREGAGARYGELELSLIPTLVITDRRREATEELIRGRGWEATVEEVWAMPSVLVGSVDQIADDLLARREEYGFSYYIVSDTAAEQLAPIVARLAGR